MSTNQQNLGRLEPIDLRTVWNSEADDFTPWLATEDNLALLGDTIGLELEFEAQEKNVGPFRADWCRAILGQATGGRRLGTRPIVRSIRCDGQEY
ncbi:MAG: hypothetical protein ABIP48_28575 [Planctomycetota bacterium]